MKKNGGILSVVMLLVLGMMISVLGSCAYMFETGGNISSPKPTSGVTPSPNQTSSGSGEDIHSSGSGSQPIDPYEKYSALPHTTECTENVTVTATEYYINDWTGIGELKLLIRNNSDGAIGVQVRCMSANNIMIEPAFSVKAEPGEEIEAGIGMIGDAVRMGLLDNIEIISFRYYIYNADTLMMINETDTVYLRTVDKVQNVIDQNTRGGKIAYEHEDIEIVLEKFEDSTLYFRVHNNSDEAVTVRGEKLKIGDEDVMGMFSVDLAEKSVAFERIVIDDAHIDKIAETLGNVSMEFSCYNTYSWGYEFKSDRITLSLA